MTQTVTILRKHVRQHVSMDGCFLHGAGIGPCRTCLKNDLYGDAARKAKHRADMETLEGYPRMGF